jgi:queuine tRNA-ribosyltransferase
MDFFRILSRDEKTGARAGILRTPHGDIETPAFLPLLTKGAPKLFTGDELLQIGVQGLMANTFHLFLRPGMDVIEALGGLHRFIGWNGPIMTDSGGFQVFSMDHDQVFEEIKGKRNTSKERKRSAGIVKRDDEGVEVRSYLDGTIHRLTPEKVIELQKILGSDIMVVLDECTSFQSDYEETKKAMERTHLWAEKGFDSYKSLVNAKEQRVFGVVQGGIFQDLREESSRYIAGLDFDGYCIGGCLGDDKQKAFTIVDWVLPFLPENKPRHFLGAGELDDLLEGIKRGIDLFDCSFPYRLASSGTFLLRDKGRDGRIRITNSAFHSDKGPVDEECGCYTCRSFQRAYLHHLFRAKEILGYHLAAVHNLTVIVERVRELRRMILEKRL